MIQILVISASVTVATIVIVSAFIGTANVVLKWGAPLVRGKYHVLRAIVAVTFVTSWLLLSLFVAVFIWGVVFMAIGTFPNLEEAIYFSIVSFTTLGLGDVVIEGDWRLLSGFVATNGLILFALVTAFLIQAMSRILTHK